MTAIAGLMTWFGICVVRIHFFPLLLRLEYAVDTVPSLDVDLHPVPSWLEGSRSRSKPPPIQIPPPTLRGMVWSRRDRPNRPPQWLFRLPSG